MKLQTKLIEPESAAPAELNDEQLMQSIIEHEQGGLDRLYARYRPLISKIVMEILPSEADAEEAIQDVFMEIWTRAANFDARKGKPLGWIICMARRRAIDHYRKIRRRSEANERLRLGSEEHQGAMANGQLMVAPTGPDLPAATDLMKFLKNIILSLPAEQGQVIRLSYFEEMSQREIASSTGIPLGTIKTRLDLAMRKLTQKSMQFREELYYAH